MHAGRAHEIERAGDAGSLDWLERRLAVASNLVDTAGIIISSLSYSTKAVSVDMPALLLALHGTKRLRVRRETWTCRAGQYAMIHRPEYIDMEAIPDGDCRAYHAWFVSFPWRVVNLTRTIVAAHRTSSAPANSGPLITVGSAEILRTSLESLLNIPLQADSKPDPAELDHRMAGVLLELVKASQGNFLVAADPSLSARVRSLIGTNPSRDWVSAHFEEALHMSGATLRRRLSEQGTSTRQLLREARLHYGLTLLQTTRKPVKTVAHECGYRSVASFRRGFLDRFGVSANTLAGR